MKLSNLKISKKVKQKLEKNDIKFKDKSKGHGTISIFSKDYVIEITSLRKDIKTFGRKAKVGFINSFEEDAKRRDFTINSIYTDLEGNLFDPFDGIKVPAQLENEVNMKNRSYFSTVMGLAFRKLDVFGYYKFVTAVKNINLLPNRDNMIAQKKAKDVSRFALKGDM